MHAFSLNGHKTSSLFFYSLSMGWNGRDSEHSPFLSANLLVRQGRYIWFRLMRRDALMERRERREHRTHRQLDWAQNKSSGCVALPHVTLPPHTQLSESHFSCCLIKPIMSYTTRLLKRHPRRTAPFWSPRGCHGSISIMSHGNRHPVICRRGSYAPKMLHNEKVQKPRNMTQSIYIQNLTPVTLNNQMNQVKGHVC